MYLLQVKHKLETEYKREQEIYAKERLEYDTQLTDEQKNALKQARIDRIESKEKRKYRKVIVLYIVTFNVYVSVL